MIMKESLIMYDAVLERQPNENGVKRDIGEGIKDEN